MMTPEKLRQRRQDRMQERRNEVRRQCDREEEQQRRKKSMTYLTLASLTAGIVGLILLYLTVKL